MKLADSTPHRLLSCHADYTNFAHKWMGALMQCDNPKKNTMLLDSGAFTAWNKGGEVTLDHLMPVYYEFMEKYWSSVNEIYLINLDKIPGSPGRTADEAEIADCIRISDENYEKLRNVFGDRVLPVYHQGENEARLHEVCAMTRYICISPRNDLHEGLRVKWSREVHSKMPAGILTHGLAATGIEMMTTVPWYSVDSASFVFTASTGSVTLCLNGNLVNLGASSKSSLRHIAGQHLCNLDEMTMRVTVLPRLAMLGYTVEILAEDHRARMAVCMQEIQYWVDNYHKFEIAPVASLFDL